MGTIQRTTSKGQLVPFVFGQTDLAASQSNVQLVTAIGETGQATAGHTAPWDGEVVGVSWALTTAATAGILTVGATVNGTEDADTTLTVPADSATVRGYTRVPRGKAPFVAGQEIGAEITTDANFLPITADLSVTVWCLMQLEGV